MTTISHLALLLTRVMLGLYMAGAGWRKIEGGVGAFVSGNFAKSKPAWLPDAIATPYGHAIPWLELSLGLLLIAGLFSRVAGVANAVLLLSIAIAVGAFKGFAPHHAMVFCALSLLIASVGPGRFSIDALFRHKGAR